MALSFTMSSADWADARFVDSRSAAAVANAVFFMAFPLLVSPFFQSGARFARPLENSLSSTFNACNLSWIQRPRDKRPHLALARRMRPAGLFRLGIGLLEPGPVSSPPISEIIGEDVSVRDCWRLGRRPVGRGGITGFGERFGREGETGDNGE
jgi:hypothetical protein